MTHVIHAWLGLKTSEDEAAAAIVKLSKLDEMLGGNNVLCRHVQEHEGASFKELFYPSLVTLAGGIDSVLEGHDAVEGEEVQSRLLWVRGKGRDISVRQAMSMTVSALNRGDVFLLVTADTIFQYNGDRAGIFEKNRARETASRMRGERPKCKFIVLDYPIPEDDDGNTFFEHLGGRSEIPLESSEDAIEDLEPVLYKLEVGLGGITLHTISRGHSMRLSQMDKSQLHLVDLGYKVYVWVGPDVADGEKRGALVRVQQFLVKMGRPPYTLTERVVAENEPSTFFKHVGR